MKILYVMFTYNRLDIARRCWDTLFGQNALRPDRMLVIDDGSDLPTKTALHHAQVAYGHELTIDLLSIGRNIGYGRAAECAFKVIDAYDPDYVYFIESDYIFRKNGLDIVNDLFENNHFAQEAVAFSGYDNPDFYKETSIKETFPRIIVEDFGEDNLNRSILYKPFEQDTKFGKIQLEFVSNSCGTMYFNWKLVKRIRAMFPNLYDTWVDKVTDKHKEKRLLNDGAMSHGISFLWNKYAEAVGLNRDVYAGLLNIKPSVANHINGGGINGFIVPEGTSFVSSPTFKE